jgi:hypothetical protein
MKDMQVRLEKLRTQIAECELIRDLATDRTSGIYSLRLAEHFKILAPEIETAMADPMPVRAVSEGGTVGRHVRSVCICEVDHTRELRDLVEGSC